MTTSKFGEVIYHRLKYFLTPQFDLYRNVRREFVHGTSQTTLDYGCGSGVGTILLATPFNDVSGIDCDECAVAFADDAFGHICHFAVADWSTGSETPSVFLRGQFDLVTCIEVIEHVEHRDALVRTLAEKTKEDGVCVVSTLNHNSQYRKNEAHVHGYHARDFYALMSKWFEHVILTDYTLRDRLDFDSSITPVVAICRKK